MSKTTILAAGSVAPNGDRLKIELVEPDDMSVVVVQVTWPLHPSIIDLEHFRDTAALIVRMFSEAHVTLARIKARRFR